VRLEKGYPTATAGLETRAPSPLSTVPKWDPQVEQNDLQ